MKERGIDYREELCSQAPADVDGVAAKRRQLEG